MEDNRVLTAIIVGPDKITVGGTEYPSFEDAYTAAEAITPPNGEIFVLRITILDASIPRPDLSNAVA